MDENAIQSDSNVDDAFCSCVISLVCFSSVLIVTVCDLLKIMTNRYQDFSYNITHDLYTRNIKYTIKRHRQSNKKKHTHIQYCL